MELYKYCSQENMQKAMKAGCLRLGTLLDYRKVEEHGEFCGDVTEGLSCFSGSFQKFSEGDIDRYPALKGVIGMGPGASDWTFRENFRYVGDHLIFSASKVYNIETHRQWLESKGYDACYKITSAKLFFRAIAAALGADQYPVYQYRDVVYAETFDIRDPRANIHPAFVKMQSHQADQLEVRAVWAPPKVFGPDGVTPLSPVILSHSKAFLYVCPHATINPDGVLTKYESPAYRFRTYIR